MLSQQQVVADAHSLVGMAYVSDRDNSCKTETENWTVYDSNPVS
jgi:hypothetical protein